MRVVESGQIQGINHRTKDCMWAIPPLSAPVSPTTGGRGMGFLSLREWKNETSFASLSLAIFTERALVGDRLRGHIAGHGTMSSCRGNERGEKKLLVLVE